MTRKRPNPPATHLARHLALAWALLIGYASLHPLAAFRDMGGELLSS